MRLVDLAAWKRGKNQVLALEPFPAPPPALDAGGNGGPLIRSAFEAALTAYAASREGEPMPVLPRGISPKDNGLQVEGLTFGFPVALASRRLPFALHFIECIFLENVDVSGAHIDALSFHRSTFHKKLLAVALTIGGNLDLTDVHSKHQIDLASARLGGDLLLARAELRYAREDGKTAPTVREGVALFCGGLQVHSILMEHTQTIGRVFLDDVVVGGILKAANATLTLAHGPTEEFPGRWDHMVLSAVNARIAGSVILGEESRAELKEADTFCARGQVNFSNSHIGGDFVCTNGNFNSYYHKCAPEVLRGFAVKDGTHNPVVLAAINFSRSQIEGGVWMDHGFRACGEVRGNSITVGGAMRVCNDSKISGALPGCELDKEPDLERKWTVCRGLTLERAQIGSMLMLSAGFQAFGEVSLRNATLNGDLHCDGGKFQALWPEVPDKAQQQPVALTLSGASIAGSVFLTGERREPAPTRFVRKPKDFADDERKFSARTTFQSFGQVRVRGTRIDRNIHLGGGRFNLMPHTPPLKHEDQELPLIGWFHSARISGFVFLTEVDRDPVHFNGSVSFADVKAGGWEDSVETWPQCSDPKRVGKVTMQLRGLTYGTLNGPTRGEERLIWLLQQPLNDLTSPRHAQSGDAKEQLDEENNPRFAEEGIGFKSQPWQQCASVLYDMGRHRDARFLYRIEQRFLRVKGQLSSAAQLLNLALGIFVGHGYKVIYALFWAGWLVTIGTVVADYGYREGYVVPSQTEVTRSKPYREHKWVPASYPFFHPMMFSLDTALPAGNLREVQYWIAVDTPVGPKGRPADRVSGPPVAKPKIPPPPTLSFVEWLNSEITGGLRSGAHWAGWTFECLMPPHIVLPGGRVLYLLTYIAATMWQLLFWLDFHPTIPICLILAFLFAWRTIRKWIVPEATIAFPNGYTFTPNLAAELYVRALGGRKYPNKVQPTFVAGSVFIYFSVLLIYLADEDVIFSVLRALDKVFYSARFGMSVTHVWVAAETLMGWLLITAVAIGLGSAVFRHTETRN